jgi:hypothetical protein
VYGRINLAGGNAPAERIPVNAIQCHCGSPAFSKPPIAVAQTDANGIYEFCLPLGSWYKIAPQPKAGYAFEPATRIINLMEACK